jgi:hypothetical protein
MSMSNLELQQEASYDDFVTSLAEELYGENIEEFINERLQSYYEFNPSIAVNAVKFIGNSEELIGTDPTASLLYSSICTEVIIKAVILKPIVSGLVHSESIAELVATVLTQQTGLNRFKELIFKILDEYIELKDGAAKYIRPGSTISLWKEREKIQNVRNLISHRAACCNVADAQLSLSVAKAFYSITSLLIGSIGFHFDDVGEIKRGAVGQRSFFK